MIYFRVVDPNMARRRSRDYVLATQLSRPLYGASSDRMNSTTSDRPRGHNEELQTIIDDHTDLV